MDDCIEVICDGPGHVRGKVTRWGFQRDPEGVWALALSREGSKKGPKFHGYHDRSRDDGGRYRFACNLCPMTLEYTDSTLQSLLELIFQNRAELESIGAVVIDRGVLCIGARTLPLIASTRSE